MSKKTKIIIAALLLLVLVAAAVFFYVNNSQQAVAGAKTITVVVTHADASQKNFTIQTDAENLRGALEQEKLIEGSESEYGLFVTGVDGETADDSLQQWWCFTKGGETLMTGVDDTMIADGEHYEATFTVGW